MDNLQDFANVFEGLKPWAGQVPKGFIVDCFGILTDAKYLPLLISNPTEAGGNYQQTRFPTIEDGEIWFEAVNWIAAARDARDHFSMATLGANYGAQAVGSCRALQLVNPMPYKLIAVEPEPVNFQWTRRHMQDNNIDPDNQWIVKAAIAATNDPVLFPIGSPGTGAQNCVATNEDLSRKIYADEIISAGRAGETLRNLMMTNSTGIMTNLVEGYDFPAEIKMISAVTLADILGPIDVLDYLESDIQQSEILVFPPFMEIVKRKVRRVHIGTHGKEVHDILLGLFKRDGWEVVFDYAPNSNFECPLGNFLTNDGVLTVRNKNL